MTNNRYKTGVVLEGGGMRGLFSAGVMDVMIDHQFVPDVACGTSAGVTFGINLPSRQRGRALRYNLRYAGDRRYISLYSLLTTGNMVNTEFAYGTLPRELDPYDEAALEASPTAFYATVTNIRTGQPEYIRINNCFEQMDVIRASASLPFVSRKVRIGTDDYLDGGLTDNIPLDHCLSLGCERVIVILTRPENYHKEENLLPLTKLWYPHDKALQKAIAVRNRNYAERLRQIAELEKEGRIFVIRPSQEIKTGRLERNRKVLQATYDLGIHDATALWPKLEAYLN